MELSKILTVNEDYYSVSCISAERLSCCCPVIAAMLSLSLTALSRHLCNMQKKNIKKAIDQSQVQRNDSDLIEEIESENNVTVMDFFKFPNSKQFQIHV